MNDQINVVSQLGKCQSEIKRLEHANAFAKKIIAKQRQRFACALVVAVLACCLFFTSMLGGV